MCVWQSEERRCAAVLHEVFAWLDGASLARAGAACRAWRRAAAAPALWRRLLHAPSSPRVCWRQEYVSAHAGWRLRARHRASAALLHAQLAPPRAGTRLALAAADASVAVWQRGGGGGGGGGEAAWSECGRADLRPRGWSAVARVHWAAASAAAGARLLLAGPLALVDDWELLVLCVEEDGRCGAVVSRVRCSAGAAGCWADPAGDAFLSLELRRLGPGLYCTTVWLNAATQETQSEYAGVTMPLLRIYNEDGEHITHALVAEVPRGEDYSLEATDDDIEGPGAAYLRAIDPEEPPSPGVVTAAGRVLVAAAGCRLAAWAVRAPRPAPLEARAAGELAERVRRHRERLSAHDDAAPEPDEATVRAGCTPPDRSCNLTAPLVGLVLHDRGRCMWAVCSDGSASCVSVAALRVVCRVRAPGACGALAGAGVHYVQPAVSAAYLAWPAGAYSARVWCCTAASCTCGDAALRHNAAAVCCVLPPSRPALLLVLAGDELYEWQSRATPQCGPGAEGLLCGLRPTRDVLHYTATHRPTDMALHVSATGTGRLCALLARAASLAEGGAGGACPPRLAAPACPPRLAAPACPPRLAAPACPPRLAAPACPPCRGAPQPACRARPASVRRAQRVVCCAPPQGARPPCAPPRAACSLTCRDYLHQIREHRAQDELLPLKESGGNDCEQDPVARRLQLAKRARRADYERDVALRAARSHRRARAPPTAPYCLGGERECARATDGCLYTMPRGPAPPPPPPRCGPGRTPPPPRCVELAPDDGCRIKGDAHLDPCAHRPRVMIEIDRSANAGSPPPPPQPPPPPPPPPGRSAPRAGDTGWCASPPPAAPAPQPCRRPTIVERLRARSVPRLPSSQNERRLHTSAELLSKAGKSIRSGSVGLDNLINSKLQLKKAGLGRVVVDTDEDRARQTKSLGGSLEMCVPVGTERVTVLVSLDGGSAGSGANACRGLCAQAVPAPAAASCSSTSTNTSCTQRTSSPSNCFTTAPGHRDTWLSIKTLQKKLTGGRCGEATTELKGKTGGVGLPVSSSQRCKGSTSGFTRETKHCSSVSTFLAKTT